MGTPVVCSDLTTLRRFARMAKRRSAHSSWDKFPADEEIILVGLLYCLELRKRLQRGEVRVPKIVIPVVAISPASDPDVFSAAQRLIVARERIDIEHLAVERVPIVETDALIEAHSVVQTHRNLSQNREFTLWRNNSKAES